MSFPLAPEVRKGSRPGLVCLRSATSDAPRRVRPASYAPVVIAVTVSTIRPPRSSGHKENMLLPNSDIYKSYIYCFQKSLGRIKTPYLHNLQSVVARWTRYRYDEQFRLGDRTTPAGRPG